MPDDDAPQPDATLNITAERYGAMWTLVALRNNVRTELGSGPAGAGIMFPVKLLDQLASVPS